MKRNWSIRHFLAFLRKQPKHMQHVYAVIFSGTITALLAVMILYFEYGFWHERYHRSEEVQVENSDQILRTKVVSPGEMAKSFFKEAATTFENLDEKSATLLEGKEIYIRE